jgi:hypothetical protein
MHNIRLAGLGGGGWRDRRLSCAVTSASGEDGRYLLVGSIRELSDCRRLTAYWQQASSLCTLDGRPIQTGLILRQAAPGGGGQPVQFVDWHEDHWQP